jgi:hypothetical protein
MERPSHRPGNAQTHTHQDTQRELEAGRHRRAGGRWPKVTFRSLQYPLDAHGVDGAFGPLTMNAVLAFQPQPR